MDVKFVLGHESLGFTRLESTPAITDAPKSSQAPASTAVSEDPEGDQEMGINTITISVGHSRKAAKRGEISFLGEVMVTVNEDPRERQRPLCQPFTDQGDPTEDHSYTQEEEDITKAKEYQSIKDFDVYDEVKLTEIKGERKKRVIDSRWIIMKSQTGQ